jgi:hypothetical protein
VTGFTLGGGISRGARCQRGRTGQMEGSMRWTQAETKEFNRAWLSAPHRQGHQWIEGQARCTACGRKYGRAAGMLCPKRKKPGHWRLHLRRAVLRAQYPAEVPKLDAAWILAELRDIANSVKYTQGADDMRFWKYHKLARRHRMLLRRWWALPVSTRPVLDDGPAARDTGWFRREKNKLLTRVKAEGTPIVRVGGCTYRFFQDARWNDAPLFPDEGPV